jgi:hypothetical protein
MGVKLSADAHVLARLMRLLDIAGTQQEGDRGHQKCRDAIDGGFHIDTQQCGSKMAQREGSSVLGCPELLHIEHRSPA